MAKLITNPLKIMGRPKYYETPEDFRDRCIEYFDHCIKNDEKVKITGLINFLGFRHKEALKDYSQREGFTEYVHEAVNAVAMCYEDQLQSQMYGGAIFALKNIAPHLFQDQRVVDMTTQGQSINKIDASKLSQETLEAIERDIASRS